MTTFVRLDVEVLKKPMLSAGIEDYHYINGEFVIDIKYNTVARERRLQVDQVVLAK